MGHRTEQPVQQIEDVRAEVDEMAATGDLGIHPPSPAAGRVGLGRPLVADAHRPQLTDPATVQQLLDRGEARHGATVVGHIQTHARLVAGRNHVLALPCRASHRLLDIDRLAGPRDADRIVPVRVRGRGDVDRVDVRIVDQLVGVVIPTGNVVSASVVSGEIAIAAHDGNQFGSFGPLESRPALAFGHVPDADDPPPHPLHRRQSSRAGRHGRSTVDAVNNGGDSAAYSRQKRLHYFGDDLLGIGALVSASRSSRSTAAPAPPN